MKTFAKLLLTVVLPSACRKIIETRNRYEKGGSCRSRTLEGKEQEIIAALNNTVADFLERNIQSLWQLELILHVRSAGHPLTVAELSRRLYIGGDIVGNASNGLASNQVLEMTSDKPPTFGLSQNPKVRQAIDETAAVYAKKRVEVIDFIFSKAAQRFTDTLSPGHDDQENTRS